MHHDCKSNFEKLQNNFLIMHFHLSLQNITIPSSVTSIGDYAFSSCSVLEKVTLGEGVKTIGNYDHFLHLKISRFRV